MLLRLILGLVVAMMVGRLIRRFTGAPTRPPVDRSDPGPTERSRLDPRRKVDARWESVERDEGAPDD